MGFVEPIYDNRLQIYCIFIYSQKRETNMASENFAENSCCRTDCMHELSVRRFKRKENSLFAKIF